MIRLRRGDNIFEKVPANGRHVIQQTVLTAFERLAVFPVR